MPQEGEVISVAFPAVWHGRDLRVRSVTEQPLYRITIAPGRNVSFNNRTANNFVISNNSGTSRAGFHLYGAGEWVRRYEDIVVNPNETINPGDFFPPGWSVIFDYFDLWGQMDAIPAPPRTERVPRDEFIPHAPVNVETDTPNSGDIILPANTRLTVTAALGEDLEIWMPRAWARQMGLIR
jgi:hypothetical protein